MRLLGHKIITGELECVGGVHIGGSSDTMEIGGIDSPIIKDPITGFYYIPGSSMKGKGRSLLEWRYGLIEADGSHHKYCGNDNCFMCRMLGIAANPKSKIGPGRLIIRDAHLTKESKEIFKKLKREKGFASEEKYENSINRANAMAVPRSIERIPAGMKFNLEMVYSIYDTDGGKTDIENIKYVKEFLREIQNNTLGGSGHRGSGKVKFNNLKIFDTESRTIEDFDINSDVDISPERTNDTKKKIE
jgi:CRISPR-associated protein Csm3